MKLFIILLLFSGIFIVVQGINNDILKKTKERVKVEYRFVPRTYFDDMFLNQQYSTIKEDIFNNNDQWFEKNISKKD
jgi:REP element-mobilizing transposase RayT